MVKLPNAFTVWDFVVFIGMLTVSMGIGIFFAFRGDRQKTKGEYLMGGRSMPLIPVAISVLVSFQSAILMLGTPAEIYTQGTEWYTVAIGQVAGSILGGVLFVPLLYPLDLTSSYEYLERRFHSRAVRLLGNFIFCIGQLMYMAIAAYAPTTALEALTGFPVWASLLITSCVATFYTSIGGMKAVVWTDVFQAGVLLAGILSILIQGTIKMGGFEEVWQLNQKYDRIRFFTLDLDPRVRHTAWGLIIGTSFTWLGNSGLSQQAFQRYCSLPTLRQAKQLVYLNGFGLFLLLTLTCYSGMVMFAYYAQDNCDLLGQNMVDNPNQLIPYFVMEILAYPTIPGLFMSSLFSGALSSVSSSLNSLAAITWEDWLKPRFATKLSEAEQTAVLKVLVIVYGCLGGFLSFTISFLDGTVIQAAVSFIGPAAAVFGIYLLGGLFPFANKYGALVGGSCGLAAGWLLTAGAYAEGIKSTFLDQPRPNGSCADNEIYPTYTTDPSIPTLFNTTTTFFNATMAATKVDGESTNILSEYYRISYLWVSTIAVLACLFVGVIVSLLTHHLISKEERQVPSKYLIPFSSRLFCCLPKSVLYYLDCCRHFEDSEDTKHSKDIELSISSPEEDKTNNKNVDMTSLPSDRLNHNDTLCIPEKDAPIAIISGDVERLDEKNLEALS